MRHAGHLESEIPLGHPDGGIQKAELGSESVAQKPGVGWKFESHPYIDGSIQTVRRDKLARRGWEGGSSQGNGGGAAGQVEGQSGAHGTQKGEKERLLEGGRSNAADPTSPGN